MFKFYSSHLAAVILSILIFFLAFWLRFYLLGKIPVSLYWDEAAMLVDAKSIAQTGLDMHGRSAFQVIFPSYGDYKMPVYIWLASLSVKLFGVSEWALRAPSALIGFLTVILGGLMAIELFPIDKSVDKKSKNSFQINKFFLSLSVSLVLALSPWAIMFARTGFEGQIAQFGLGLSVWLLLISKKRWPLIIFSALFGAAATYTYFSVRFIWLPLVIGICIFLYFKRKILVFQFLILIVVYLISLWPMYQSPLYQDSNRYRLSAESIFNSQDWALLSNQYRQQAGNQWLDRLVFHRNFLMMQALAKNAATLLDFNYLFFSGDPNLRHGTGQHGLFLWVFLPFFLLGLFQLADKYKWQGIVLISWWLLALIPASVPMTVPHALRSINALIPMSLIIGLGLFFWLQSLIYLKNINFPNSVPIRLKNWLIKTRHGFSWLSIFASFLVISLIFSQFWHHYLIQYRVDSAQAWQDGFKPLALEILKHNAEMREVWVEPFDQRFYLYLLAFGPYSAVKFQQWPIQDYQLQQVANIFFVNFNWSQLENLDHKILIVGKKESLEPKLMAARLKPTWQTAISGVNPKSQFLIVAYEK